MEITTNYQYTVVYDCESMFETVIARLLHRVQIVPSHGVDEFLAIDMLAPDAKFTYTPEVVLFSDTHKDAFIHKGFPSVLVLKYDDVFDRCTLTRSDFVVARYIELLAAYSSQTARAETTVAQANAFMTMMAGGIIAANKAEFIRAVSNNILSQISASIGIGGIERLHSIMLSGGVIREVEDSDINEALNSSTGYPVEHEGVEYRVAPINTRASMHKIADIARKYFDFSRVILINYTPRACDVPSFNVSIINETPYPTESILSVHGVANHRDIIHQWLFDAHTQIKYATVTEKNDIIKLLYGC